MGNACCCSSVKSKETYFEDCKTMLPQQRRVRAPSSSVPNSANTTMRDYQIPNILKSQQRQAPLNPGLIADTKSNFPVQHIERPTIKVEALNPKQTKNMQKQDSQLDSILSIPMTQETRARMEAYQKQISWATIHESFEINQRISSEDIRKIYEIGKEIGSGRYGIVRLAQKYSHPKKRFAVKSIPRETIKTDIHLLEQELDILKSADHPNIINFYEIYKDRQFFHIVTEFCEGGELFDHIIDRGSIPEKEAAVIISKIVSAILNLHKRNISHRDLKPENILFEVKGKRQEIKVIDFGLSKYFSQDSVMTTKLGTPYYVSPEVLEGKYDKGCDIWSIGVIAYIMLCGYPPFNATNETQLFRKIMCSDYEFKQEDWKDISESAQDFIRKCLQSNPAYRITAEQALLHPWLKSHYTKYLQQNIHKDVLLRIKNFKKPFKFQFEVLKVLGQMLHYKETQSIKETFQAIDDNLSGSLTFDELYRCFIRQEILSEEEMKNANEVCQQIFNNLDFDSNGEIHYSEFLVASLDPQTHLKRENIRNAFKYFDGDDCDCLSFDGLKKVFLRSGKSVNNEEIEKRLTELNLKADDKLSFQKFCYLIDIYDGYSPTTTQASLSIMNSDREEEL